MATLIGAIMAHSVTEAGTDPFEEGHASRKIAAALEQLSACQRAVFVLFELEGISGKEIAQILECPEATVFRRLHDARKLFVEAIEAGGGRTQ